MTSTTSTTSTTPTFPPEVDLQTYFYLPLGGAWSRGPEVWSSAISLLGGASGSFVPSVPKPELLARGEATIDRYAESVVSQTLAPLEAARRARYPNATRLVVLAHSAGGAFVPAVAHALEQHGQHVDAIVLVTAFAPVGASVLDLRPMPDDRRAAVRHQMANYAEQEQAALAAGQLAEVQRLRDLQVLNVPPHEPATPGGPKLADYYTAGMTPAAADAVRQQLVPEPFGPLDTVVDFGLLAGVCPVHYILCRADQALPLEPYQMRMLEKLRARGVVGEQVTVDFDHGVVLNHPGELALAISMLMTGLSIPLSQITQVPDQAKVQIQTTPNVRQREAPARRRFRLPGFGRRRQTLPD